MKQGTVFWNELNSRNAEKAQKFYAATLGWTFDSMPGPDGGTYYVAKVGDEMVAGLFTMEGPMFENVPEHWFTYFTVDDVDAAAKDAVAHGGKILREPFDVPGTGRFVIVEDALGAAQGWATPSEE